MTKTILVIDYSHNWFTEFAKCKTKSGEDVVVEQTEWPLIDMVANSRGKGKITVKILPSQEPFPFTNQKNERLVEPDGVLIRNFPRELHDINYKNFLMGLIFAQIPGVNTPSSIFMCQERPLLYAALLEIRNRLGRENFPLIDQTYFPNLVSLADPLSSASLPCVVKVSNTHAGAGKMKIEKEDQWNDVCSTLALTKEYYTSEEFLDNIQLEYRVQRIGDHVRVYKRQSDSCWKGNWGNIQFEDLPVEERHLKWSNECSRVFGGLDMFAIDVVRLTDGSEVILELNDTAAGFMYAHENEDAKKVRDIMLEKL